MRLCSLRVDPFYSFCGRPKQNNPFYYTQTIKQQKRCKTTGWTMISNDRVLYIMYILKNHHVYCHSVLLTWELKGHNHFRQGSTPTRVPRIVPPFKSSCIYMLRKHLYIYICIYMYYIYIYIYIRETVIYTYISNRNYIYLTINCHIFIYKDIYT